MRRVTPGVILLALAACSPAGAEPSAGDRLCATPGYGEPVVALDAATGRIVRQYEDTNDAVEIACHGGVLCVVAGSIDRGQCAEARRSWSAPALVNHDDVVLSADCAVGKRKSVGG
jgi:hypothetical protein